MWVYQQTGTPAHLPEAAQPLPTGEAALLPQPQKTLPPERSAPEVPSPLQRHNTETRQKTCWLLVCAFLIGSGSAGVLLAFCEKQQPDWLQYYLQSWRGLFAAADAHTAASLFGMEYLTLAAAATLLFLTGFSALGPVLIFLFTMFYGLGNGTLFVQLLSDTALKRETWLLLLAFLPAAAAFRHSTEKGNVASAACISACGSCFCRAVHARHRFSAGEQPDPRLFLFCSRA